MEIRRALSQGANWAVSLSHIPSLLELIDEQQIPVDICLTRGTGTMSLRAESVYYRRCARSLMLEGTGASVRVDLDRLAEARAVSRSAGAKRRISLQLIDQSGMALLTITGPTPDQGLVGQVWHSVMESLLPAKPKVTVSGDAATSLSSDQQSTRASQPLDHSGRRGRTPPASRRRPEEGRFAVGSHG